VLRNFGSEKIEKSAIEQLAGSLCRLLDPVGRHCGNGLGLLRLSRLRRPVAAGPTVAAAGHRRAAHRLGSGGPLGRRRRAGAVRPARLPDTGSLVQARSGAPGDPQVVDRLPARDQRRCALPGDGLPAPGQGRGGEEDLRKRLYIRFVADTSSADSASMFYLIHGRLDCHDQWSSPMMTVPRASQESSPLITNGRYGSAQSPDRRRRIVRRCERLSPGGTCK